MTTTFHGPDMSRHHPALARIINSMSNDYIASVCGVFAAMTQQAIRDRASAGIIDHETAPLIHRALSIMRCECIADDVTEAMHSYANLLTLVSQKE